MYCPFRINVFTYSCFYFFVYIFFLTEIINICNCQGCGLHSFCCCLLCRRKCQVRNNLRCLVSISGRPASICGHFVTDFTQTVVFSRPPLKFPYTHSVRPDVRSYSFVRIYGFIFSIFQNNIHVCILFRKLIELKSYSS